MERNEETTSGQELLGNSYISNMY